MIIRYRLLVLGLAASGAVAGLGATSADAAAPAGQMSHSGRCHHTRTFKQSASGDRVVVDAGHEVRLDLKTARDGGYAWVVTRHPQKSVVSVVKKTVRPYKHRKHEAGYPYHSYYLLKATGDGTTTIKLVERRSFDHHDIAQRFTLTIHVRHRSAR